MNTTQTIPVCFTFDKNFVIPAVVAIYSLLQYADRQYFYHLYVLHMDIPQNEQQKLKKGIACFKDFSSIEFIDVSGFHVDHFWGLLNNKQHYSKEIYNKLILDRIFPQYDRIICSDVDVVFRGDISKSYFLFPDEPFYVAGIRGILRDSIVDWYKDSFTPGERAIIAKGIGAGYLLLNLDLIRKHDMGTKMCIAYKKNLDRLIQPEQDIMNLCCYPHICYIPFHYMICAHFYSIKKDQIVYADDIENAKNIFENGLKSPIQIHYAGFNKPWNSFFIKKEAEWFKTLADAGFIFEYVKKLPFYLSKRCQKYSLRRFIHKIKNLIIRRHEN